MLRGSDASDALNNDEAAAPSSEKAVVASAPSTPPVLAVFFFLAIGAQRYRFVTRVEAVRAGDAVRARLQYSTHR